MAETPRQIEEPNGAGKPKNPWEHLVRHPLTPARRAAAAALFGGSEVPPDQRGLAIWRLHQPGLRDAFAQVYGCTTSSCNNRWMRGKLLQAVGLDSRWAVEGEQAPPEVAADLLGPVTAAGRPKRQCMGQRRPSDAGYHAGDEFDSSGSERSSPACSASPQPAPTPRHTSHCKPRQQAQQRRQQHTAESRGEGTRCKRARVGEAPLRRPSTGDPASPCDFAGMGPLSPLPPQQQALKAEGHASPLPAPVMGGPTSAHTHTPAQPCQCQRHPLQAPQPSQLWQYELVGALPALPATPAGSSYQAAAPGGMHVFYHVLPLPAAAQPCPAPDWPPGTSHWQQLASVAQHSPAQHLAAQHSAAQHSAAAVDAAAAHLQDSLAALHWPGASSSTPPDRHSGYPGLSQAGPFTASPRSQPGACAASPLAAWQQLDAGLASPTSLAAAHQALPAFLERELQRQQRLQQRWTQIQEEQRVEEEMSAWQAVEAQQQPFSQQPGADLLAQWQEVQEVQQWQARRQERQALWQEEGQWQEQQRRQERQWLEQRQWLQRQQAALAQQQQQAVQGAQGSAPPQPVRPASPLLEAGCSSWAGVPPTPAQPLSQLLQWPQLQDPTYGQAETFGSIASEDLGCVFDALSGW